MGFSSDSLIYVIRGQKFIPGHLSEILCSFERSIKIESIHEFTDEKRENYTQIIDNKFYYFKKISKEIDTNLFDQLLCLS